MKSLNDINLFWEKNCSCELKKSAKRPVFGYGSKTAKVVFIGEAPGKKEDETGKPFVGSAGKILDQLLLENKMSRDEVYITNIVKYRPPENRDPSQEEKSACRDWLYDELNFINPKLIVFLGRHSMNDFLPDLTIGEAHGKLVKRKIPNLSTEYFLPLYHPAATIYNRKLLPDFKKDFSQIQKILKKI